MCQGNVMCRKKKNDAQQTKKNTIYTFNLSLAAFKIWKYELCSIKSCLKVWKGPYSGVGFRLVKKLGTSSGREGAPIKAA